MSELRSLYYLKAFGYDFCAKDSLKWDENFKRLNENLNFSQRKQKFRALKAQISNCQLCALSKKRSKSLFKADFKPFSLMIIKEFISKKESQNESFFQSTQGKELENLLLKELDLKENELYLSSIYKCFNDEKPDFNALNQCLPYIFEEIKLLRPKFILILGQEVFEALGFIGFKEHRGYFLKLLNALALPSFDLDFLAKNPSHKQEFIKDLQKFKPYLQNIKQN